MYQLVDFGNGRKLEQFSHLLVDRPSPVAFGHPLTDRWQAAQGRFEIEGNHKGAWSWSVAPKDWKLSTCFGEMELFPSDFGHVGMFAEQAMHWSWLSELPLAEWKLLNLFAYTGGSSLAAASAGAQVTHVDSAKNMVRRASDNARLSKLGDKPIRWIVEDARRFVERESKRGNQYDGVILDPPTYGHGASAKTTWKIDQHLPELFSTLEEIIPKCQLMLFTCHSIGYPPPQMQELVRQFQPPRSWESGIMNLQAEDGRELPSGNFVRWFRE